LLLLLKATDAPLAGGRSAVGEEEAQQPAAQHKQHDPRKHERDCVDGRHIFDKWCSQLEHVGHRSATLENGATNDFEISSFFFKRI